MRAFLIAALVASLAFAGCTSDAANVEPTANDTNSTAEPAEPTPEEPAPNCVAPAPAPCVEPPAN